MSFQSPVETGESVELIATWSSHKLDFILVWYWQNNDGEISPIWMFKGNHDTVEINNATTDFIEKIEAIDIDSHSESHKIRLTQVTEGEEGLYWCWFNISTSVYASYSVRLEVQGESFSLKLEVQGKSGSPDCNR